MILNMLEDVPHQWPVVKDLVMNVLVEWVFKGLPLLHLTLWLFRNLCCEGKGSFP